MLVPPALAPGDRIEVVAPSGPFDRTHVFRGLAWLSERYRVTFSPGIRARNGYLAGDDERRLSELSQALASPEVRAIVAARGGYGASRICHRCDFSALQRHPKWLVGFSDFTVLHLEATRAGVCSVHGPDMTILGRGDAVGRERWLATLEAPHTPHVFTQLLPLAQGAAAGPLAGGNLSLVESYAAAGRLRLPTGAVLFLEEVNEAPYRIDRMLTALLLGGHLDTISAVCVGHLTGCGRPDASPSALEVFAERLKPLGIPVLAGVPAGHAHPSRPLLFGGQASLRSSPPEMIVTAPA